MQRRKPRIVLAENDPDWSAMAREALEGEGYALDIATTAAEARTLLGASGVQPVDVAIFDLHLVDDRRASDRSGLDLAREYPGLRRVIWTAQRRDGQMVVDAHREGILVSLKREDPSDLVHVVRNALATRLFLVHGHDQLKDMVELFLRSMGLQVTVLADEPGGTRTIIELLEASTVEYAVALLTPDDEGRQRNANHALRPRARQNVVFELGFFAAALGRDKVFALCAEDLELPSDCGGIRFIPYGDREDWKKRLRDELKAARVPIAEFRP